MIFRELLKYDYGETKQATINYVIDSKNPAHLLRTNYLRSQGIEFPADFSDHVESVLLTE